VSGSEALLTGLLYCGRCGARMAIGVAKGGQYWYYACSAYVCKGKSSCLGTRVPMGELHRQVLEYLGDRLFTIERMAEIVRQLGKELATLR
jgi:site-specific DNA recombinase